MLDPDYVRLLHPLDLDPAVVADELQRLREALKEREVEIEKMRQQVISQAATLRHIRAVSNAETKHPFLGG